MWAKAQQQVRVQLPCPPPAAPLQVSNAAGELCRCVCVCGGGGGGDRCSALTTPPSGRPRAVAIYLSDFCRVQGRPGSMERPGWPVGPQLGRLHSAQCLAACLVGL